MSAIRRGDERGAIYQANLIPPGSSAASQTCISRISSCANTSLTGFTTKMSAIGKRIYKGLEHLTTRGPRRTPGRLPRCVGRTNGQDGGTTGRRRQIRAGRLVAGIVGNRFEHDDAVSKAKRLVYLKLMEKYQKTDRFKFIIYSGRLAEQTPQMTTGK